MQRFEYRVIPAPLRGEKARGVKSTGDRFALALTNMMNALGAEGWEYVRADTLPCEERTGLTGTKTTFQNLLVFRRAISGAEVLGSSEPVTVALAPPVVQVDSDAPAAAIPAPSVSWPEPTSAPSLGAARRDLAAE